MKRTTCFLESLEILPNHFSFFFPELTCLQFAQRPARTRPLPWHPPTLNPKGITPWRRYLT